MPNRYVREGAIESEAVNSLGWLGEVFFRRLINRVDDFGRFSANVSLLRAKLFPLQLERVRDADIARLLAECEKAGLLFVYADKSKKPVLVVNKWENGRAKRSEYDPPPEDVRERMQTFVYSCKHELADSPDSDPDSDPDPDSDKTLVPPGGLNDPTFVAKWAEYVAYRRELRFKPLLKRSVVKQWAEMEEWGLPIAIAAIDRTITKQWQGIFHPSASKRTEDLFDRGGSPNLRV